MTKEPLLIERKKSIITGECPRCAEKGQTSNLILIKGVAKETGNPFEFSKCEVCAYTQPSHNGKLLPNHPCPQCSEYMYKRVRTNGQHFWNCPHCKVWILADENFAIVDPPMCTKHNQPMKHTSKKSDPDLFYWYCSVKDCLLICESDKYGKITYEESRNASENSDENFDSDNQD